MVLIVYHCFTMDSISLSRVEIIESGKWKPLLFLVIEYPTIQEEYLILKLHQLTDINTSI